jgi:hypothetical protein
MAFLGALQDKYSTDGAKPKPGGRLAGNCEKQGVFGQYDAIDSGKAATLPASEQATISSIDAAANKNALSAVAVFACHHAGRLPVSHRVL